MAENVIKMNYTMDIHRDCIKNSLVAPHLTTKYKFEGAKGVIIEEPQTVEMQDYTRTGTHRYGTPTEVQYYAQEMIMGQDKSFSLTIDKGNQKDRSAKAYGAEVMRKQVVERAIPMQDAHSLYVLAHKAGTIVGNATALEKGNVVERIFDAGVALDDAEFPTEDRTLFVSSNVYKLIKLSEEFSKVDKLAEKSLTKGLVGYLDNMKVIKVPKKRWPANVNFILVHKSAGTAPTKIKDAKMYLDAPGISGYLLEGRNYFDCFVIGHRCEGVYAEINTASGKGTIVAAPTIAATTAKLTSTTSGASFKYTLDGSDPRYSKTAIEGAGPATSPAAGTVVKAYAYLASAFDSAVTELTI